LNSKVKLHLDDDWGGFLKRGAVVGIIRVLGLVCVFLLQIVLARLIGDTGEYGKYAWGQSLLFMLGALAAMGIPVATSQFIASLSAQNKENAIVAVVRQARRLLLRSSSVLIILSLCLALVGQVQQEHSFYLDLSAVALFLAPGVALMLLYQQMSRARHWLILAFLPMQILRPLLTGALAATVWWLFGQNLNGIQALLLVGLSVFMICLPQFLIYDARQSKLLKLFRDSASDSVDYHPTELFRTSLPILITRIAGMAIEYSNVLLVGYLAGPAAAGAYFAAERLARLSAAPAAIVASVIQPEMAAANARGNQSRLRMLTKRAAHSGLWPTAMIVFLLVMLAGPLLGLFGDEFSAAEPVLVILALGLLAQIAAGPANDLLLMTGKQNFLPRVMVSTAIIHLALLGVLVPALGATGAALTSSFSGVLSSLWLMRLVKRELSIDSTILARKIVN
jgi:O-antigen/teichoic acid export membrane protein